MKLFNANKLTVKATKGEMISFGTGKHPAICMKQTIIEYKNSCKHLGLHLDTRLKFVHHIENLLKKLNKLCGFIYRN